MKVGDFDYDLPRELIAQEPPPRRDASRLMVLFPDGHLEHRTFPDVVELLGDRLIYLNDTRVIPARLFLHRQTGGKVEALLVRRLAERRWIALLDSSRRLRDDEVLKVNDESQVRLAGREGGAVDAGVRRGA